MLVQEVSMDEELGRLEERISHLPTLLRQLHRLGQKLACCSDLVIALPLFAVDAMY